MRFCNIAMIPVPAPLHWRSILATPPYALLVTSDPPPLPLKTMWLHKIPPPPPPLGYKYCDCSRSFTKKYRLTDHSGIYLILCEDLLKLDNLKVGSTDSKPKYLFFAEWKFCAFTSKNLVLAISFSIRYRKVEKLLCSRMRATARTWVT